MLQRTIPLLNKKESEAHFRQKDATRLNVKATTWVRYYMFFEDVVDHAKHTTVAGMDKVDFKGRQSLHWQVPILRERQPREKDKGKSEVEEEVGWRRMTIVRMFRRRRTVYSR